MKVEAVENKRHSCLMPMAQGALVGSAVGFVTKYTYPLNADEKNSVTYKKAMEAIEDQKKVFGPETEAFLQSLRKKQLKTPAEDVFVKMFDDVKDGEKLTVANKRKAITAIQKEPDYKGEFKALCHELRNIAEMNAKKSVEACTLGMKHIRPSSFFVAGGAVIGAIIALIHDVLRTEVHS